MMLKQLTRLTMKVNEQLLRKNRSCLLMLACVIGVFFCWKFFRTSEPGWEGPTATVNVQIDSSIFVTDEKFLSFGMDSNLIRHGWVTFDFDSPKLKALASALSPAYLRLMGTDGDRMMFDVHNKTKPKFLPLNSVPAIIPDYPFPRTKFNMTAMDWDSINGFVKDVGWRLLFGINGQTRTVREDGISYWDPKNALELLEYSVKQGYHKNIDFEFGNEPESWRTDRGFIPVKLQQLALEYKVFRQILNDKFDGQFKSCLLAGPGDVSWIRHKNLTVFLNSLEKKVMHAVTWHFYNGDEKLKDVKSYIDPVFLDKYENATKLVIDAVRRSTQKGIRIWQGEASSTVRPPGNGIAQSYVATFMLLDKLGLSAKLGMDVVVRQTFYGFWFALVDHRLYPRPNYWLSWIFKKLVGKKVFATQIETELGPGSLRGYSHCTSSRSGYPPGSIVVYSLNLFDSSVQMKFTGQLEPTGLVDQYLLTAPQNNLTSIDILLNGELLKMKDDNVTLPKLQPIRVKPALLIMPPHSLAFYVFPDAKAKQCM